MRDRRGDDREPPLRRGIPLRSEREERTFISVPKSYIQHSLPLLTLLGGGHMAIGYLCSLYFNCLSINKIIKSTFGVIENSSGNLSYL